MIFNRFLATTLGAFSLLLSIPALAEQPPKLIFPVDCTLNEDCWFIQHPDVDPGDGFRDYGGFTRSYNGHNGVDIGISDIAAIDEGFLVLAPADGRVLRARDGMVDEAVRTKEARDAIYDRACGNAVVLSHAGGLETQICHMRQGSVLVQPGQIVEAGDPIGEIGMSGLAEFPHIQLSTRLNGVHVDAATGKPLKPEDADKVPNPTPLWGDAELTAYDPLDIVQIGFGTAALTADKALDGRAHVRAAATDPPALVVWTVIYGTQPGDRLTMTILDPVGDKFFDNEIELEEQKVRIFRFSGRRVRQPLDPGVYTGRITIERGEGETAFRETKQTTIRIEPAG
ncbi:MAG: M23 family metallopeptidase [Alphaproteobacteria bacterium]|nr:M23 family metallopeptidase [Alphaproteobacteria bacterium SS10]